MMNPGGTGRPRLVISARFAPLPPKRSFRSLLPSAKSYTYFTVDTPASHASSLSSRGTPACGPANRVSQGRHGMADRSAAAGVVTDNTGSARLSRDTPSAVFRGSALTRRTEQSSAARPQVGGGRPADGTVSRSGPAPAPRSAPDPPVPAPAAAGTAAPTSWRCRAGSSAPAAPPPG